MAGPRLPSVLRITAALIFLEHGTQKLVGGVLLLGLFTRPVAFIASGEMAFAYFISHAPRNFFPAVNGGDAAILHCFVFLQWPLPEAGSGASTTPGNGAASGPTGGTSPPGPRGV